MVGTFLVMGGALLACLLILLADRLLLTPCALVTPEDVLISPGHPILLRVTVERDILPFWDPPIVDVEVTFHAIEPSGRRSVGTAKTNTQGIAELSLPPLPSPERKKFIATLPSGEEASFIVDVIAPDHPVFVIDIDCTISNASQLAAAIRDNRHIRPFDGAAAAVRSLESRYAICFLTARDHLYRAKTLDWLRSNGFPEAPVLLRRKRLWRQSAEAHKRERLTELAPLVRLSVGIGDLPADARVYCGQGMRTYLLGRSPGNTQAIAVPTWDALLTDLTSTESPAKTPHPR